MHRISTGQPRVRTAPAGFAYAPMPVQQDGEVNRKLQGGYPPVAWRARNDWGDASGRAREPFSCKAIAAEVHGDRRALGQ